MIFKTFILFLVFICLHTKAAKILAVFSIPSISHQVVFRSLTQELVNKGHEVTVITTDPAYPKEKAPPNLREIDVHDVSYGLWQKFLQAGYKSDKAKLPKFIEMKLMLLLMSLIFKVQIKSPQVQELIRNKGNNFDLLIIEDNVRPALAYSHIFKAPVILISSFGGSAYSHDIIGSMTHPFLYPSIFQTKLYSLTLWDKLNQLYNYIMYKFAGYLSESDENALIQEMIGPDVPPLSKLYDNVHMLFVNVHRIWADNQPVPPGVVYMGGIHQLPEKELPKDLKTYLDSSKHGVIYVSFGTNMLSGMIPEHKLEMMTNALSKLPYDVLWKWDKNELPGNSSNLKISTWLPQSDLLRHPKIKLFVTQAGLQSTDETITAGVPVVSIPMIADQWYNAEKHVKHGIGEKIELETLTEESFQNAVKSVIENENYRKNVAKLRKFMLDEPEPPLQRAIWWIEYVLRHKGAKQLRASSANISFAEYFELKLLFIITSIMLISLIFSSLFLIYLYRFITSKFCSKKKLKTN